jgi:acyl-CoA-binding protein
MALDADFAAAQTRVKGLSRTPDTTELLELYALYKQGTSGDVQGGRPGMLDFKGRAKFDAWSAKKGVPRETAQRSYVELVERLAVKYG